MDTEPAAAPPKKKSLFTAKALARKAKPIAEEDELFDFSRGKELAAERFAEEERKRVKRERRKQSEQEVVRKRSSRSVEEHEEPSTTTPPKKRKVSASLDVRNGHKNDDDEESPDRGAKLARKGDDTAEPLVQASKKKSENNNSFSPRYTRSLLQDSNSNSQPSSTNAIILSDSDESDVDARRKKTPKQSIPIDSDEGDVIQLSNHARDNNSQHDSVVDEEEEYPELVAQAVERERKRAETAKKSFAEKNHAQTAHDSFGFDNPMDMDPPVQILITSDMEGAIPLCVKRKMSQKLREARFAWCDRQSLPQHPSPKLRSAVFLTWKREKVYDYTTCSSLGLKLDDLDGMTDGTLEGKVHLEAWTEEAFAIAQKAENEEDQTDEEPEEEQDVKIKLVMAAKDMEPVKLVVRKKTLISKLISAFIGARDIPDDKDVALYFDGDELDPEDAVENTELESMDSVEVRIK